MIDWKHLEENNETYLTHFSFAFRAGVYFFLCGTVFLFHSFLPWIKIPRILNLTAIEEKVRSWNEYTFERLWK